MTILDRQIMSRQVALAIGSKRYFTGQPCIRGHIADRFTVNKLCDGCRAENARRRYYADVDATRAKNRESRKRWYRENSELANSQSKAWRTNNSAWVSTYRKTYYLQHREKMLLQSHAARQRLRIRRPNYGSEYYWAHREIRLSKEAKRYAARPEYYRSIKRADRVKNPARYRAADSRKRTLRLRAPGHHSALDINAIRQAQRDRCAYCQKKLSQVRWHVDHIQPLSRGGTNFRNNLQVLCAPCNQSKYAKDPIDFARSLGRLL